MTEEEFDWDDGNLDHIARHNVTVLEAEEALLDPNAVMTSGGRILVVVFTFRGDAIRPITAYDAAKRDQEVYLKGRGL